MDKGKDSDRIMLTRLLEPEALFFLLNQLKAANYKIGIRHYTTTQGLLIALHNQGERVLYKRRLQVMLGSILCSSALEQAHFRQYFESWWEQLNTQLVTPKPTGGEKIAVIASPSTFRSSLIIYFLVLLGGVGLSAFLALTNEPSGGGVGGSTSTESINLGIFLFSWLILLLLLIRLWWEKEGSLGRRLATTLANQISLYLPDSSSDTANNLFSDNTLHGIVNQWQTLVLTSPDRLDIPRTITATVHQAGWLTPVYAHQRVSANYLILIDRITFGDQQAQYVTALVEKLQRRLNITYYYFDGDPRLCFSAAEGQVETLHQLQLRYSNYRLLVFSEPRRFFSSRTGQLADWVEMLAAWSKPALLTASSLTEWQTQKQRLGHYFQILPATVAGLEAYQTVLDAEASWGTYAEGNLTSYPAMLRWEPQRWIDYYMPDEDLEEMLTAVRDYLGEASFAWLKACAVFPEMRWDLTLYLGKSLIDSSGHPLYSSKRVATLIRLPWFRYNYMPDWLRECLLHKLTDVPNKTVHEKLHNWLGAASSTETASNPLVIAEAKTLKPSRQPNTNATSDHLQDRLFVNFMSAHDTVKPLDVLLPKTDKSFSPPHELQSRTKLIRILQRPNWQMWFEWTGITTLSLMLGLGLVFLLFAMVFGSIEIATTFSNLDILTATVFSGLAGSLIGTFVGYGQWRFVLKAKILKAQDWIVPTAISWFVVGLQFPTLSNWNEFFTTQINVILALLLGSISGVMQKNTLQKLYPNALVWLPVTFLGWYIGWATSFFGVSLYDQSVFNGLANFGIFASLIYGGITGIALLYLEGWRTPIIIQNNLGRSIVLLFTLVMTVAWFIGGAIGGISGGFYIGLVGGVGIAFVLWLVLPKITRKQVGIIILGATIGGFLGGAIYQFNNQSVIFGGLGGMAAGVIAGISIAIALQQVIKGFGFRQLPITVIGWAIAGFTSGYIGYALSVGSFGAQERSFDLGWATGGIVSGIIFGLIGGIIIAWQLAKFDFGKRP